MSVTQKYSLWICLWLQGIALIASSQDRKNDSVFTELDAVVVSFNQWEQKKNEVPNRIVKIDLRDNALRNPQTAADMLALNGGIFIQKSQQAGGSPMIRGFSANRVLIMADGVRMNNAIFRSGNLQNVISIDPHTVENAEVIMGPGAIIYGSDAIGGVIDFHTLTPQFSPTDSLRSSGHVMLRHALANQEQTLHADLNIGHKRFSWLGSFSHSDFNDLRMGRYGGQNRYLRPQYIVSKNGNDVVVENEDPRVQRFTGYTQTNLLQKVRFRPHPQLDLQYAYTLARTGEAPRYDRLIQYRQGTLRFAEWKYAPMVWQMHRLQLLHNRPSRWYDRTRIILAMQRYAEGRSDRSLHNKSRNVSEENLTGMNLQWDSQKSLDSGEFYFGLEGSWNRVGSHAYAESIATGWQTAQSSRYPNGSTTGGAGLYGSIKRRVGEKLVLTAGGRLNAGRLAATFDTTFLQSPILQAKLVSANLTGNGGLVYQIGALGLLHLNLSTGFRMPNVDDLGKTFESTPGRLTIPNPGLRPEYAYHAEIGAEQRIFGRIQLEASAFFTWLDNAIVRRAFTYLGSDSIDFQGTRLAVEALTNSAHARVWGIEWGIDATLGQGFSLQARGAWINGQETDDAKDVLVPLRHAPPMQGTAELRYRRGRSTTELSWQANGTIQADAMPPTERAKPEIFALDATGAPYCPGWHSISLRSTFAFEKGITISVGCENLADRRFRTYSSGIVSPGRNFIASLRYQF